MKKKVIAAATGGQAFPLPLMGLMFSTTPDCIAVVGNLASKDLVRRISPARSRGDATFPWRRSLRWASSPASTSRPVLGEREGEIPSRQSTK